MNLSLNKFVDQTYRLKNLVRYQTSPRIKEETVLEHLGFTTMIVVKLRDDYEFDLQKAMLTALFHDWAEKDLCDIPYPVKKNLPPHMIKELENLEVEEIRKNLGNDLAMWIKEFNESELSDRSIEGMIVAYADALSVLAYARKEAALGNKEWFEGNVIPYTEKRLESLRKLLEPHLLIKES